MRYIIIATDLDRPAHANTVYWGGGSDGLQTRRANAQTYPKARAESVADLLRRCDDYNLTDVAVIAL